MPTSKEFRSLLTATGGNPSDADLQRFIRSKRVRMRVVNTLIRTVAYGILACVLWLTSDSLRAETGGDPWKAAFLIGMMAMLTFGVSEIAALTVNATDRDEAKKAEHARSSLARAAAQIEGLLNAPGEYILFLRNFEGERLGGSETARPRTRDEIDSIRRLSSYGGYHAGPTASDLERHSAFVAATFDWSWVNQLDLLRASRGLRPVVLLDNFELDPDKQQELEESRIQTVATTTDTWWHAFERLATRTRLVVVLLRQRTPSVLRELEYLSRQNTPYLLVTTKGLILTLQRYAPCYLHRAGGVVAISERAQAVVQIQRILGAPVERRSDTPRPPDDREQREDAAIKYQSQREPPDLADRDQAVFQLANCYSDINRLARLQKLPWAEHLMVTIILNLVGGLAMTLIGIGQSVSPAFRAFLEGHLGNWIFLTPYLGPGLFALTLASLLWFVAGDKRIDRQAADIRQRLRTSLLGQDYKQLMAKFSIPMEELQWVLNLLRSRGWVDQPV